MDEHTRVMGGVLRRMMLSFDLPPSVRCGPGTGLRPPTPPPSSSDEEDPSEAAGDDEADAEDDEAPYDLFPTAAAVDPADIASSSRLVEPKREPVEPFASRCFSPTPSRGYRVEPLERVVDEVVLSDEVDVETGLRRVVSRTVRTKVVDLETELIVLDSDTDVDGYFASDVDDEEL